MRKCLRISTICEPRVCDPAQLPFAWRDIPGLYLFNVPVFSCTYFRSGVLSDRRITNMVNKRHTAHEPQPSTPASKAIEPLHPRSRWSEWALHNSGLYYYRARYISFEDISSIPPTGRNSIVPNVQGGYIHYQSMGVNEGTSQGTSQAPELSTCSTVTTPTASDPPVSAQEVYGQQNDQLVVSTKTTKDSMLMSGALQPEADTTETVVVISNSSALKRKSTPSKKQKEKKKHGKKLDVDKRKQVSNKAKVNKWLDTL